MGGATESTQSSKASTNVPGFQKKYLQDLYSRAQSEVANNPTQYYPGQTVAGQDPATLGYQSNALDYAQSGGPAASYLSNVVGGQYLDPASNPYLRGTYDQAARAVTENYQNAVLPAINSRFALAGQAGSGNYAGAFAQANNGLSRSLGELGNSIYGGNFQAERDRQQSAAPILAANQMDRLGLQQSVGQQRQQYQQSLLDDLIARFDFAQNEPAQRLSRYAGLLGNPITLSNSRSSGQSAGFDILKLGK